MVTGRGGRLMRGAMMLGLMLLVGIIWSPTVSAGSKKQKPDYLDRMLKEAWDSAGVKPSAICPDPEFVRRAYLDFLGRTPTIDETIAFLENRDKGKRIKLIEALLEHPDFAKNFSVQMTNVLLGRKMQQQNVNREALTTWLRRQFADNKPWDEITYQLIAAKGSNRENGAVNFALAHMDNDRVPLTSTTTRVFLGLQIQCTQCHDHPSNDWKQADFWGINAFFKGVRSRPLRTVNPNTGVIERNHVEVYDEPTDAYSSYDKRNGLIGVVFPTYLDGRKTGEGTDVDRRKELAKYVTEPTNADFSKAFVNRIWAHFMGRGFVHPVDDFGDHNPPSHPELLDKLAEDFRDNGYDVKDLIRWVTNSQAYHVTSVMTKENEKDETLFSHMTMKPMNPEQLFESLMVATWAHKVGGAGDTDARRDAWMRQFIFTFGNDDNEETNTFQGTIPQALMMMNGDQMDKATGGRPGSFLAELLERAQLQRRVPPENYVINYLYLGSLNRYPNPRELARAREFFRSPDQINVIEDLFWALLNSNEFVLNH